MTLDFRRENINEFFVPNDGAPVHRTQKYEIFQPTAKYFAVS
jgi:hypothetical protein